MPRGQVHRLDALQIRDLRQVDQLVQVRRENERRPAIGQRRDAGTDDRERRGCFGPGAQLVPDDKRSGGCPAQYRAQLEHLDDERRVSSGEIVAQPDAREDARERPRADLERVSGDEHA